MTHFETLKKAITHEMVNKAAETLGEDKVKVATAVKALLPSLMGKLIDKGENTELLDTVKKAAGLDLIGKKDQLFEGHGIEEGMNLGERFENDIIGSKNSGFPEAVAAEAGISHEHADRLSNWVSAIIAGYIGHRMVSQKRSMAAVLDEFRPEKGAIIKEIPARLSKLLGLGAVATGATHTAAHAVHNTPAKPKKKSLAWLWWLIGLIIVALLVIFLLRSCNKPKLDTRAATVVEQVKEVVKPVLNKNTAHLERIDITLPDGQKINALKGGTTQQLYEYLKAGHLQNATVADLDARWFHFDDLDFLHNSANEMVPGSMTQLNNLAKILKNYPDVKIIIGGYADNTGGVPVNNEISKERAAYVKSVFVHDGVNATRIGTEGFGKKFATVPANATDAQRAIDRAIALRLNK